jgi:hypothetical protein
LLLLMINYIFETGSIQWGAISANGIWYKNKDSFSHPGMGNFSSCY